MTNDVQVDMLLNAKQMLTQLQFIDGKLNSINYRLNQTHTKGAAGAAKHGRAMAGLALRFVGYNLILNQVMGAQQKLYTYITEGVTKFREFETRIAEVSTIMTEDFEAATMSMKAGIEDLALTFGQNTSDLTKGLYDIMSAAFSAKDAMSLLNTATKASIAGLSDVRTSVDIFTTVLNTYGMSVYEATKVSDTLFQSVVRGKFQFAELESALGYVVPIAAQAGIAFEELMAALSTATRHGLHLDMASRGLAMALQNIVNPSEGAAKAAQKYGIEMSGLALRVKGIAGVFGEMYDKTKEYGKIVLNELIPNIRSLRVAMVLAGEEGLEGMIDDLDRLSISAGRTEQALTKIKDTSQFASNQITQDWEKTQREVGEAWDNIALGAQKAGVEIIQNWKSFLPIVGPIFTALQYNVDRKMDNWAKQKQRQYLGTEWTTLETKFPLSQTGMIAASKAEEGQWHIADKMMRDRTGHMKVYLDLQKEIANTAERMLTSFRAGDEGKTAELGDKLIVLNTFSAELGEKFNEAFGEPILGGIRRLEDLRLTLEEISFDVERLRDELEKPMQFGWGGFQEKFEEKQGIEGGLKGTLNYNMQVLLSEQKLIDVRHDISAGLADETYNYKVLNEEQQRAVQVIREHEAAMKSDREETALMNIELRKLHIQMLELQLVGMIRRRGLTRNEQKRMKALQIEQAKLRLKNLKETKEETAEIHTDYFEKKNILDDYVRDLTEHQYQLKYSYDQQVTDLQATINYERGLLNDRVIQWDTTTHKITTLGEDLTERLEEIISDPNLVSAFDAIDIDVLTLLKNVESLVGGIDELTQKTWPTGLPTKQGPPAYETWKETATAEQIAATTAPSDVTEDPFADYTNGIYDPFGKLTPRNWHRGTEYVHESGLAEIHKGETIGAAGKEQSNGISIDTVIIEVKEIADIDDPEKLAAVMSSAKNSKVLNRSGKTTYRIR